MDKDDQNDTQDDQDQNSTDDNSNPGGGNAPRPVGDGASRGEDGE